MNRGVQGKDGDDDDKANLTERAKQTQEMVIKLGPGRAVSYIEAAEAEVARMRKALQQVQARDPQFQVSPETKNKTMQSLTLCTVMCCHFVTGVFSVARPGKNCSCRHFVP